jgi:hypothetical protein
LAGRQTKRAAIALRSGEKCEDSYNFAFGFTGYYIKLLLMNPHTKHYIHNSQFFLPRTSRCRAGPLLDFSFLIRYS